MGIARSSYYYRSRSQRRSRDAELLKRIEAIAEEFPRYGYRRITRQLQREGIRVNHKRVLRIMREHKLLCRRPKKWIKTTDSRHSFRIYPNLVKGLTVSRINQVWLADITYIRLLKEYLYLAALLDYYSRKAIGHCLSENIDTKLTVAALSMAIERRKPEAGVIHHSDQGVQYASQEYVQLLKRQGFHISMAAKGNPFENAVIESFFKTLKQEEVYLWEYRTRADAYKRIGPFIELVYNRKRLHSSLGYRPPEEFEALELSKNQCQTTLRKCV
jgi:putative transposase